MYDYVKKLKLLNSMNKMKYDYEKCNYNYFKLNINLIAEFKSGKILDIEFLSKLIFKSRRYFENRNYLTGEFFAYEEDKNKIIEIDSVAICELSLPIFLCDNYIFDKNKLINLHDKKFCDDIVYNYKIELRHMDYFLTYITFGIENEFYARNYIFSREYFLRYYVDKEYRSYNKNLQE